MFRYVAAICVGASSGAVLRWLVSSKLNALLQLFPLGTFVANLLGAYLIGCFFTVFEQSVVSPIWRLMLITGFCGALTTFSSFSLESVALISSGRYGAAFTHSFLHLAGSLVMVFLGMITVNLLRGG